MRPHDAPWRLTGVAWALWRRHVEQQRARVAALARAISIVGTAQEANSCAVAFRRWTALTALQVLPQT